MKFLAIEKSVIPLDLEHGRHILEQEAHALHLLYTSGHVREFYFNQDHDAVLVLECQSKDECEKLLQSLPLVEKGFIRFDLMELRPYTGFERLFTRPGEK